MGPHVEMPSNYSYPGGVGQAQQECNYFCEAAIP